MMSSGVPRELIEGVLVGSEHSIWFEIEPAGILIDSLWVLRVSERSAVDMYLNGGKVAEFVPDGVAYTALELALSSILPSYSSGSALPAGRNCRSMKPNCS